jgi:hypothetical protein
MPLFNETDYEYDPKDVTKIQTAFQDVRKTETLGFWVGFGSGTLSYFFYRKYFNWNPATRGIMTLLTGVTAFNLYTHRAREEYGKVAHEVNTRVNLQLHKMMN